MVLFRGSLGTDHRIELGRSLTNQGACMTQRNNLAAAAGISLLVHVGLIGGWAWWGSGHGGNVPAVPEKPASREISVKIQPPLPPKTPDPALQKPRTERLSRDQAQSARTQARSAVIPNASEPGVVSAKRVLDDPSTGLVFSVYFKAVRAKLVRQAAAEAAAFPTGGLPVHFILARDGSVERVLTPAGTSEAAQGFAERLVAAAGPFPPFPSSIRHASISFDVLFRFDENVLG
jgi:hypothetical protein